MLWSLRQEWTARTDGGGLHFRLDLGQGFPQEASEAACKALAVFRHLEEVPDDEFFGWPQEVQCLYAVPWFAPGEVLTVAGEERARQHFVKVVGEALASFGYRFPTDEEIDQDDAERANADAFGACPVCNKPGVCRNVGRRHWFACDEHRQAWCIGDNLFSGWREETSEIWEQNARQLTGYTGYTDIIWPPTEESAP